MLLNGAAHIEETATQLRCGCQFPWCAPARSQSHIAKDGQSVSQSVSLGVKPNLGLMTGYLLLFDSYGSVIVGRPL
jgi:hypothetical protein